MGGITVILLFMVLAILFGSIVGGLLLIISSSKRKKPSKIVAFVGWCLCLLPLLTLLVLLFGFLATSS